MFFLKDLPSRQMIEGYSNEYGFDIDGAANALSLMRRASLLIRQLESYFAEHRLSQLRFLFLIVIDREPERDSLTVGEITERLDVAGPVIARTLQVLVKDGLVTAERDPSDARTKHVRLTESGRKMLARLLPGYFEIIAGHTQRAGDA